MEKNVLYLQTVFHIINNILLWLRPSEKRYILSLIIGAYCPFTIRDTTTVPACINGPNDLFKYCHIETGTVHDIDTPSCLDINTGSTCHYAIYGYETPHWKAQLNMFLV